MSLLQHFNRLRVIQADAPLEIPTGITLTEVISLTPIMTNFRVEETNKDRVYFDTPLGPVTGIDPTKFYIEGRQIDSVNTDENYFELTTTTPYWENALTIRQEGGNGIVYDFTMQYISNYLDEVTTTNEKFVAVGASGTGTSIGDPMSITAAFSESAIDTTYWIEKGDYGAVNCTVTGSGGTTQPIKFVGYDTTPGDNPSITFARDITFDANVMPLITGSVTSSNRDFIIFRSLQVDNANPFIGDKSNNNAWVSCYAKGGSINFDSSNQFTDGVRNTWINCWSQNATNANFRIAGVHCAILGCYSATEGDPNMDYAFSIYGHEQTTGNHVIKGCTINADYLDSHSGHGYSLKADIDKPLEYCLIENSTCIDNKSPVQLRHELVKYCVVRNVTAEWSGNEGASSTWEGIRIVSASYNSIEDCHFKNMEYPIYFLDSTESAEGVDSGNNNTFKNCIFSNDLNQVLAWIYIRTVSGTTRVPNNNSFINCTFDSNGTADLFASSVDNTGVGNVIENSILLDTPSEFLSSTYDPGFSFTNNDFFGCGTWADSYIGSDGNFEVDPELDTNYEPQATFTDIDVPRIDGVYYGKNGNERQDPTTVGSVLSAEEIPSQATLLFKSGMENPVIIHALDYDPLNYGYRYLQGSDVPPYSWGDGSITGDDPFGQMIPSYDMGSAGVHVLGVEKELSIQEFVTINGYDGNPTRVLRQTMEGDVNVALQQCPFQLNRIKAIPNKTYLRWQHRYDSLDTLTNDTGSGSNRMLWQYKSELWYDGTDPPPNSGVRTSLTLIGTNDGTGKLYWLASSDIALTGGHPENSLYSISTTNEPDPSMGLNVDGWNLMEVIITWGSGTDGGIVFRLNNVEVFNITGVKTISVDDTLLQFLTLWQFYGGKYGTISEQWLDGVEIWNDDPQLPYTPPVND